MGLGQLIVNCGALVAHQCDKFVEVELAFVDFALVCCLEFVFSSRRSSSSVAKRSVRARPTPPHRESGQVLQGQVRGYVARGSETGEESLMA